MKYIIFVLAIVLLFSLTAYADRNYVDSMCYAAMWNTGSAANVKKIHPIKKWNRNANEWYNSVNYFSYGTPYGASANTPDHLEESSVAQYYFFDDDEEVSIFFYFDKWRDPSGGEVEAVINSTGLAGKNAFVTVRDDPGDSSYAWDNAKGTSNPFWRWWPCCTDGMVLGNLPQPVEKTGSSDPIFNPSDHSFCVNMFFKSREGVTEFKVQTLPDYYENLVDNKNTEAGRSITSFSIPSELANSLQLCYTQCNCPENSILDSNRGNFDNKAVVEGTGVNSGIGRYTAGKTCSWNIRPAINPDYVAVYFREFVFDREDDKVEFFSDGADSIPGDSVRDYPTGNNEDDLNWSVDIFNGLTEYGLSTYNSFLIPNTNSGDTYNALVKFVSDPLSKGALGFIITYVSVAETDSVSPFKVSDLGGEIATITGKYFLDEDETDNLICRITLGNGGGAPWVFTYPATYVSSVSVTCPIPAKPLSAPTVYGNISISNDGIVFFNEAPFEYDSLSCDALTTCKTCSANSACGWCSSTSDPEGLSFCEGIPNLGDLTVRPSGACSDAGAFSWHPEENCCDVCSGTNSCSGNGACTCDDVCDCTSSNGTSSGPGTSFTGTSCDCECPTDEEGNICSGAGTCDCADGCTCTYPARGDYCECKVCPGFTENDCYNNGVCGCDGNCVCNDGFDENTQCQCPDSCEIASNGLECGGEKQGRCECGACFCEEGYDGDLCDCADPTTCPGVESLECSGHGYCQCDRTCVCDPGYTGEGCEEYDDCHKKTCETCSDIHDGEDQSHCVWCPVAGVCVNMFDESEGCKYVEYDASNTTKDDTKAVSSDHCPVLIIGEETPREPNDTVTIAAIIAAIVGVILAIIIGAILAFLGKTQSDGLTSFDFGNDNMGAATSNPLFAGNAQMGSSSIYQGK